MEELNPCGEGTRLFPAAPYEFRIVLLYSLSVPQVAAMPKCISGITTVEEEGGDAAATSRERRRARRSLIHSFCPVMAGASIKGLNKRARDSRIEALTHLPTPCVRTTISTRAAARFVLSFLSRANCSSQSRTLPSLVSQSKDTVYAVGGVEQEKL